MTEQGRLPEDRVEPREASAGEDEARWAAYMRAA
jgi:hypothetical protein